MSQFGQAVATTLLLMKMDTSDVERKLKSLKGAEADAARATLEAVEKRNAAYDSWAKRITQVNVALKLVTEGVRFGADAWKSYAKFADAAGGADKARADAFRDSIKKFDQGWDSIKIGIGKVVTAFGPLLGTLGDVLSAISKIASAANKIPFLGGGDTPPEIDPATGRPKRGRGGNREWLFGDGSATDLATVPLRVLSTEGAERWTNEMGWDGESSLYTAAIHGEASTFLRRRAEDMAFERGQAINAANAAFREIGGLDIFGGLSSVTGARAPKEGEVERRFEDYLLSLIPGGEAAFGSAYGARKAIERKAEADRARKSGAGGEPFELGALDMSGALQFSREQRGDTVSGATYSGAIGQGIDFGGRGVPTLDSITQARAAIDSLLESERERSILVSIFGEPEEIDLFAEKMGLLSEATQIFGSALQSNFDAWVSGSKSGKEAIKAFFTDSISAIASSLMAHAIEHGAAAVGALAFGNPAGAAMHGKAAALYAAGAVAVGGIARKLGAGGSAGAGAGGGAPSVIGSSGGSSGGTTTIVLVGDGLADDSPRMRARHVARSIQLAERELSDVRGSRDG